MRIGVCCACCAGLFGGHKGTLLQLPSSSPSPPCSIVGEPGSVAVLSVREDGGVSGMALRGNSSWAIGRPGADQAPAAGNGTTPVTAAPLSSKKAQAMAADVRPPFTCANDGVNFGGRGPEAAAEAEGQEAPSSRKLKQVRSCCV